MLTTRSMHYSNAVHPDLRTFRDAMRSEVYIIVRDFRWNTDVTQQLRDPLQTNVSLFLSPSSSTACYRFSTAHLCLFQHHLPAPAYSGITKSRLLGEHSGDILSFAGPWLVVVLQLCFSLASILREGVHSGVTGTTVFHSKQ